MLTEWEYCSNVFSGSIFADSVNGVVTALDNEIKNLQAGTAVCRIHNILSEEDITRIFTSRALSKATLRAKLLVQL